MMGWRGFDVLGEELLGHLVEGFGVLVEVGEGEDVHRVREIVLLEVLVEAGAWNMVNFNRIITKRSE